LEFLRDGECVPAEKLRELILDHIAWEEHEFGGPEGVLDGLVRSYIKLKQDPDLQEDEDEEEVELDCVDGRAAEEVMLKFYTAGYRAAYDLDIPKENSPRIAEGWSWPASLTYSHLDVFPRDLCEQIGYVKGHMSGRHSVAMRKYAEEHYPKQSNG
jgi:hypothetical protein